MSRVFGSLICLLEDVGVGVVALLTAVVAGAVGVVTTLQLTAGTPYAQADLDRAVQAYRLQADPLPAAQTTDAGADPADRTAAAAAIRSDLEAARARAKRLQRASTTLNGKWSEEQAKVARLQQRVARLREQLEEATTALEEGTTPVDGETVPPADGLTDPALGETDGTDGTEDPAPDVTLRGAFQTTWTLSPQRKPWPKGCPSVVSGYQVRVNDGAGTTVAVVSPRDIDLVARDVTRLGSLQLTCSATYEVVVPQPLGTYQFWAVADDQEGRPLAEAFWQAGGSSEAPRLSVAYCPGC